jgi:carbonic anhydrase
MHLAQPLPDLLVDRYREWRAARFEQNREDYAQLAKAGQSPRVMIISCCDSRVIVTEMFGAEAGDYFIHRNIAALVPPHAIDNAERGRGTLSSVEYAVKVLDVDHILVIGHSGCGGVASCLDMVQGEAPHLCAATSYIGQWLRILEPCVEEVRDIPDRHARLDALERAAVLLSLRNLMTLPFVAEAVHAGRLALHGAWKNIGCHELEVYEPGRHRFVPLPG